MRVVVGVCPGADAVLMDDGEVLEFAGWLDEGLEPADIEDAVFIGFIEDNRSYAIDLDHIELMTVH